MLGLLGKIITSLKTAGVAKTLRIAVARLRERYCERSMGVATSGIIPLEELGIRSPSSVEYCPTDYAHFRTVMQHLRIRASEDVFIDYGSGKGRIVVMAATYPFRKVIGVEFSKELNEIAQANVRSALPRLQCRNIELVLADASEWRVPDCATVLYFFNPFHAEILAKVAERIRESLAAAPRGLRILWLGSDYFAKEVRWQDWLTRTTEIPCGRLVCEVYESKLPCRRAAD